MIRLAGASGEQFQYSPEEQIYTLERSSSGQVLYAKEIDFGVLPNTTSKEVAHNIPDFLPSKVHRLEGNASSDTAGSNNFINLGHAASLSFWGEPLVLVVDYFNVAVTTNSSFWFNNNFTAKIRIIYAK